MGLGINGGGSRLVTVASQASGVFFGVLKMAREKVTKHTYLALQFCRAVKYIEFKLGTYKSPEYFAIYEMWLEYLCLFVIPTIQNMLLIFLLMQ